MYRQLILEKLETYKKKGYKKSKFANLYSVVREVLNEKVYEHSIYEGLDEDNLRVLTEKINIVPAYQQFLKEVNGFDLYEGKISLFGLFQLKKGMSREQQMQQPHNILEENKEFEIDNNLYLLIGLYKEKTAFVLDNQTEEVYEIHLQNGETIQSWESFYQFYQYLIEKVL